MKKIHQSFFSIFDIHIALIVIKLVGLLLSYSDFRTTELDQPFWQVKEKAGAKVVGVGRFFNCNSLAFDLGEWDSPAWLNQIMS